MDAGGFDTYWRTTAAVRVPSYPLAAFRGSEKTVGSDRVSARLRDFGIPDAAGPDAGRVQANRHSLSEEPPLTPVVAIHTLDLKRPMGLP